METPLTQATRDKVRADFLEKLNADRAMYQRQVDRELAPRDHTSTRNRQVGEQVLAYSRAFVEFADGVLASIERPNCSMGVYCREHNFIHGLEAEELRQRLERFISFGAEVTFNDLQRMLDEVDARDSVTVPNAAVTNPEAAS